MPNREENNLDLKIRSLMDNAEEPVPEHVWAGISSRLDGLAALRAKRAAWFRRAAVALAAAAALALIIFLPRKATETDLLAGVETENLSPANPNVSGSGTDQNPNLDQYSLSNNIFTTRDTDPAKAAVSSHGNDAAQGADTDKSADAAQVNGPALKTDAASDETTTVRGTDAKNGGEEVPDIASQISAMPDYLASADIKEETDDTENGSENVPGISLGVGTENFSENGSGIVAEDNSRYNSMSDFENDSLSDSGSRDAGDTAFGTADPFAFENERQAPKKKVRSAITMSGEAMGNVSSSSGSASSGIHKQMTANPAKQNSAGIAESTDASYGIPASFGLGVKIIFTPRWSLGVGLNYSLLSRTFRGVYTSYSAETESYISTNYSKIRQNVSYIGIPVNAYFSIVRSHAVDFYAYAGGTAEKLVGNRYVLEDDGLFRDSTKGFQFSADLGIGVEFIIVDMVGIYIDPSLRYYFPDSSQPRSIRTEMPLNFGFEIGFRIRL